MAVIQTESQFNPNIVGSHGEIGLMQIKPDTAKWIAQKENITFKGKATLKSPTMNIKIGIAYLAFLRGHFQGSAHRYVSAYNMGPGNVKRLLAQAKQPREYATRVMTNYNDIYRMLIKPDIAAL
jgi:soluble lytic murein transglycosylase